MESLLKQLQNRARAPGPERGGIMVQGSRRRTGPRKSVSFDEREDNKKAKGHSRNHSVGGMNHTQYWSTGELEMAVAAATYAINRLPNEGLLSLKKPAEGISIERSTTRTKSQRERESAWKTQADSGRTFSSWLSGKERKDDRDSKDETEKLIKLPSRKQKYPEKEMGDAKTIKWAPTLSNKNLNDEGRNKGEKIETAPSAPTLKPSLTSAGSKKGNQSTSKPNNNTATTYTYTSPWEKAEMNKIKKRYEKMMATISQWENEKKIKAKRKLDNRERKLELKRARALQEHRNDVVRIDKIAGSERALADERRRNDEAKMREKAMERNSKPASCFCF